MKDIKRIYIDYNATTPIKPEVKDAIVEDLEIFGNASSLHTAGRLAKTRVTQARTAVGKLLGVPPKTIVFTSGGSEANNTVFQTMRRLAVEDSSKTGRNEFIITAVEHPCVLNAAMDLEKQGFKVTVLPVDEYGKIRLDDLRKALSEKTLLVSVMAANNEIGTIQDIKEITQLVKASGAWMHTDAVQAVGKIPVNAHDWGVDYLTMSAHKIYGPKGVGALYIKEKSPIIPLIRGGHQEDGLRAGTYNNIGILGFGKAAEIAAAEVEKYGKEISALRDRLRWGIEAGIPNIRINSNAKNVLPNTLNVSFPGAEGEAILLSLDIKGIEASTGSACASGSLEPSHVLMAIGLGPEMAHGSIRFSLGWGLTEGDIDYIIGTLPPVIGRLRIIAH